MSAADEPIRINTPDDVKHETVHLLSFPHEYMRRSIVDPLDPALVNANWTEAERARGKAKTL